MPASASNPNPTSRAILAADGRVLLEQPDGSYRPAQGQTDWVRLDATSEAELAAAIAADPDGWHPPLPGDPGDPLFCGLARAVWEPLLAHEDRS